MRYIPLLLLPGLLGPAILKAEETGDLRARQQALQQETRELKLRNEQDLLRLQQLEQMIADQQERSRILDSALQEAKKQHPAGLAKQSLEGK